jgi:hypothetical protein
LLYPVMFPDSLIYRVPEFTPLTLFISLYQVADSSIW